MKSLPSLAVVLALAPFGVYAGGFLSSCTEIAFSEPILCAVCADESGNPQATTITLDACIGNNDGSLGSG